MTALLPPVQFYILMAIVASILALLKGNEKVLEATNTRLFLIMYVIFFLVHLLLVFYSIFLLGQYYVGDEKTLVVEICAIIHLLVVGGLSLFLLNLIRIFAMVRVQQTFDE